MNEENKEMFGDYTVIQSLQIGNRSLLICYNPDGKDGEYLCCFKEHSPAGTQYTKPVFHDDYLEVATVFSERLHEHLREVSQTRTARNLPRELLGNEHCLAGSATRKLTGKLVVLRPDALAPEYRAADYQLGYVTKEYSFTNEVGRTAYVVKMRTTNVVEFHELYSDKKRMLERGSVLGIADSSKLPTWTRQKISEHKKSLSPRKKERGEAR